ncbi:rod shape-determining protein MreD [Xinfangfangia sp. D13-10-4-6]|uniref:rod shape-determining protein MreD n=1 Tax=Pseudogemmobacter hezensis TaxID=2737662 RepID=UPI001554E808|nr:rod shape-determining protein MreD [Pseudogemmobacter hezensis]NPD15580.1 rod shape-determining protein MreD [Pseudogemmobacter hezensis]
MSGLMRMDPWGYRLLFLGLACLLLFTRLLPLQGVTGRFPGPDLLMCLIFAWMMRRPDFVPVWLLAPVILTEDLLLMRPPGLETALVIMATEFLRARHAMTRELNFAVEWLVVSGLMIAMLLGQRLILTLTLVDLPPFGFAVVQVLWSIVAYPVVVGLSRLFFDLRKPATGEVDDYGRRL